MQPIFLKEVYKDYLWGGQRLKKEFNKESTFENIAESWEVAANKNGDNIVLNGMYKDLSLKQLYEDVNIKETIFGTKSLAFPTFPILIKFIDALRDLSIQVHPDDKFLDNKREITSKNEAWYVIDCEDNSQIICGINTKDKNLDTIIKSDNIEKYLKFIDIKKGDMIFIPAGLVHAIKGKILVYEVQQNNDTTYRIYDYNRLDKNGKKRKLHINEALTAIKPNYKPTIVKENNNQFQQLIKNNCFNIFRITINNYYEDMSSSESFYTISIIEGTGKIICNNMEYPLEKGDSFIIPATLGKYTLKGNMKIIKVSI